MKTNSRKPKRPTEAKTSRTAKRNGDYVQRLVQHTAAARVNSMESEKLYLQNLVCELAREVRSITDRIHALDRQITAEKASVPNAADQQQAGGRAS